MEEIKDSNNTQNDNTTSACSTDAKEEVELSGMWSALYYIAFIVIFFGICIAVEYIATAAGLKSSQFSSRTYDSAGVIILLGEKNRLKKVFLALSKKLKNTDSFSIDIAIGTIFGIIAFFYMIYLNLSILHWADFLGSLAALFLYYTIPYVLVLIAQLLRKKNNL